MPNTAILSESISPLVPIIFFGAIGLGLVAVVFALIGTSRRRSAPGHPSTGRSLARSLAIAVGWIATVAGALLILMLATTRGGAPSFMYVAAALPLIAGVRILQITRRRGPDSNDSSF